MKRITLILLTLLAFFVAACSSDQSGSSADESAAAEQTEEVAPEPAAETTPEPGAGDLAGLLPTEVGGIAIEYESSSGEAVIGSEGVTPEAQEFFDRVGAVPSDLSSAFGIGIDQEEGGVITIGAIRVAGADEGTLRDEFRASIEDQGDVVTEGNIAGKEVLVIGEDETEGSGYFYVKGDVVFIVGGSPASLAEEALSQLP